MSEVVMVIDEIKLSLCFRSRVPFFFFGFGVSIPFTLPHRSYLYIILFCALPLGADFASQKPNNTAYRRHPHEQPERNYSGQDVALNSIVR